MGSRAQGGPPPRPRHGLHDRSSREGTRRRPALRGPDEGLGGGTFSATAPSPSLPIEAGGETFCRRVGRFREKESSEGRRAGWRGATGGMPREKHRHPREKGCDPREKAGFSREKGLHPRDHGRHPWEEGAAPSLPRALLRGTTTVPPRERGVFAGVTGVIPGETGGFPREQGHSPRGTRVAPGLKGVFLLGGSTVFPGKAVAAPSDDARFPRHPSLFPRCNGRYSSHDARRTRQARCFTARRSCRSAVRGSWESGRRPSSTARHTSCTTSSASSLRSSRCSQATWARRPR